jgi:hypothetical protein
MYNLHNPKVRKYAQTSPKHLEWVLAFVFSTIRVQTSRLPIMMKEYRKRGLNSSWIWGNKVAGLNYVRKNRTDLYTRMMQIIRSNKKDMELDLILLFLEVPGLGLPKAGFACQLVAGKVGCMDVHNIRKFLPDVDATVGTPTYFQTSGNPDYIKRKKAIAYIKLCKDVGGCKFLWNVWCTDRSVDYPKHFPTPFSVSAVHESIWK